MAHCIPTYMLASGLIGAGMSWWQALFTILLGNIIVLVPILANSHAGTKYGIPFPVYARAAYGTVGSNLPALMRALVACGWFGINCWIGGQALHTFFKRAVARLGAQLLGAPAGGGHAPGEWIVLRALLGAQHPRRLSRHGSPAQGRELGRAVRARHDRAAASAGRSGARTASAPSWRSRASSPTSARFFKVFVPSLTAMIGFWATLSLNMPDFTRFGRSQREQVVGQVVALPTTMTVFAAMGIIITSATAIIYGKAIWDPVELVGQLRAAAGSSPSRCSPSSWRR